MYVENVNECREKVHSSMPCRPSRQKVLLAVVKIIRRSATADLEYCHDDHQTLSAYDRLWRIRHI